MMRALWSAASGMSAQQLNVDNITHNLSNVNTTGFKRERLEFQSLLYETMTRASLDPANMTGRPVNLQVGHGVRPVATSRMFAQGSLQRTDNSLDFAIEGNGFFTIQRSFGEIAFTRDGSFKLSPMDEGLTLVTSSGYLVLNEDGGPIVFPEDVDWINVMVDETGAFWHNTTEAMIDLGLRMQVVQFPNVQGLEAVGGNLLIETIASGAPMSEADGDGVTVFSRIHQGLLEMSNVQVAEEMVNIIIAQRAYDLASRAIHTSDEMLQTAVNLRR
jgi:flagellar basal-body rod protein FlgG